ncbi:MAG TPA: hypothetical protein VMV71_03290 [Candidatus Paceibacterota bacterium]|nr:hypothetical protein [Candidatus Paceibacterota bacterium]
MANILEVIFYFVVWFLTPAILLFLIWLIKSMANKAEDKKHRAAMRSGYWAGIMLFLIMLIYQISIFLETGFPRNEIYQGFSLPLALGSALVVFILFLGKKVTPPVISGLLVLAFTFIAFSALVHYLFIRTYNDVLLSSILGGVFGFLTHFAASPTSLKEFLKGKNL